MDRLWSANTSLDRGGYVDLLAGLVGVISSAGVMFPHVKMILNVGIYPDTNSTIIPSEVFDIITTPYIIENPDRDANAEASAEVYGLGWGRLSYLGHDIIGECTGDVKIRRCCLRGWHRDCRIRKYRLEGHTHNRYHPHGIREGFRRRRSLLVFSPPANQSAVSRRSKLPRLADVTARADDDGAGTSPSDVDVLTGTYYSAGYGGGDLCGVRSISACGDILAAFYAIGPSLSPTQPQLTYSLIRIRC